MEPLLNEPCLDGNDEGQTKTYRRYGGYFQGDEGIKLMGKNFVIDFQDFKNN